MFSLFRGLVGGKSLSDADITPVLDKLQDHLISKNVAAEISEKLCNSVRQKLEGKVIIINIYYFLFYIYLFTLLIIHMQYLSMLSMIHVLYLFMLFVI